MTINRIKKGGHSFERGVEPIVDWLDRQYALPFRRQKAPAAKTTATQLTAAEVVGGLITGQGGAAVNYQMPTGTNLEAAFKGMVGHDLENDDAFEFSIINIDTTSANAITVTSATDVTLVGRMSIAGNAAGDVASGRFLCRRTGTHVFVVYRLA